MKTFNDLEFVDREDGSHQSLLQLGGVTISVVYGQPDVGFRTYSDVDSNLYEVAAFFGNDMIPLQVSDDVLGWQTAEAITKLMEEIQTDVESFISSRNDARHVYEKELELS